MTHRTAAPEVHHAWAIYLQASEEARRRVTAGPAPITSCSPCWRIPRSKPCWA